MDVSELEQTAIDITRLTNSREKVACVGLNDAGTIQTFRSSLDSIDAVWKCIDNDFEPVIVSYYATMDGDKYIQGNYHYIK